MTDATRSSRRARRASPRGPQPANGAGERRTAGRWGDACIRGRPAADMAPVPERAPLRQGGSERERVRRGGHESDRYQLRTGLAARLFAAP